MTEPRDGSLWVFTDDLGPGGPWMNPGQVQGPPGIQGPPGAVAATYYADLEQITVPASVVALMDVTRQWVIPNDWLAPGSWFVVETTMSGVIGNTNPTPGPNPNMVMGTRLNAAPNARLIDFGWANMANSTNVGAALRAVYQVYSPTQVRHWIETSGPAPRFGTPERPQGNNSAGTCSTADPPNTVTAGADLIAGITARWGANVAGQTMTFHGSRLYRYAATLMPGSDARRAPASVRGILRTSE